MDLWGCKWVFVYNRGSLGFKDGYKGLIHASTGIWFKSVCFKLGSDGFKMDPQGSKVFFI